MKISQLVELVFLFDTEVYLKKNRIKSVHRTFYRAVFVVQKPSFDEL